MGIAFFFFYISVKLKGELVFNLPRGFAAESY